MKILLTGGAGFIGSAVIRHIINNTDHAVINIDKLTYSANLESLNPVSNSSRYQFIQMDICDAASLQQVFNKLQPDAVMHLAAESHVDRSIDAPAPFIQTNLVGTFTLLEATRLYWQQLTTARQENFRLLHVSTDEVYGDLANSQALFSETTAYAPSSPYAASKAGADHLVRAWYRTYGLPIIISNCSNNYGPYQFPEKLIPLMILNALAGKPLPVYGQGQQSRDWLFVEDHASALLTILQAGQTGTSYNVGGHNEQQNIQVVKQICRLLDELLTTRPPGITAHAELITHVADRPGHDLRYAIDASKIATELGWLPQETFATGLRKTVLWYLTNQHWWQNLPAGGQHYQRLGIKK